MSQPRQQSSMVCRMLCRKGDYDDVCLALQTEGLDVRQIDVRGELIELVVVIGGLMAEQIERISGRTWTVSSAQADPDLTPSGASKPRYTIKLRRRAEPITP
jgi:hypothetical protein